MTTEDIVRRLDAKPTAKADTWLAKCPAHEDHNASLSISTGADGRTLLHCHANCPVDAIVAAMGLTKADLFSASTVKTRVPQIVATYDYTDEAGALLFQVVRFSPKGFRQRRPDPARPGDWIWNLDKVPRVPYRLPELIEVVKAGRTIFIVEGEKDVEALVAAGFVATTNAGGAGKWDPEFSKFFQGAARVVVVPDNDEPGKKHAGRVCKSLHGHVKDLRILELPQRNGAAVKDAGDWFAAGGTPAELKALTEAAPTWPLPEARPRRAGGLAAEYLEAEPGQPEEPEPSFAVPEWPAPLAPEAFHGLAGEVVRLIEPHSESDPAAVLISFLASWGSMVGPAPHFVAEARQHPCRVWAVQVGTTSKSRKGSGWANVRHVLHAVDENWVTNCTATGLSSGEGLIHRLRDPHGEDEGVTDKRLLTIEEEFGAVLKVAAREGNTLSALLRRAWDDGALQTMTRNSPCRATGAHVTVLAHITKAELTRLLTESDSLNGFGNRFSWLAVRRSKFLPEGGQLHTENIAPLVVKIRQAVDHARKAGLVGRSPAARELWHDVYPTLTADRPGLFGAITARGEAQVMRLALIYALLDRKAEIELPHLEAALAVWAFSERSARYIFGEALGDKLADRVLDELRAAGQLGLSRNSIREIFRGNVSSAKIDAALGLLKQNGLADFFKDSTPGAGRTATFWRAIPKPNPVQVAPSAPASETINPPALDVPAEKAEEEVAAVL